MRRTWLGTMLALLGAACATPPPRLPFQKGGGDWRASVIGGPWIVNKDFGEDTNMVGLEVVLDSPETGGWSWEAAFRYGSGESDGTRRVYDPDTPSFPYNKNDLTLIVPSEREIQFYELDVGVRQYYRRDSRLQPYFGVGLSVLQSRSEEHFVQPALTPDPNNPTPRTGPITDHERSEILPGIYGRLGLRLDMLRDQLRDDSEFPLALDVRGMLSLDYSYLEFSLSFGFGR